MATELSKGFVRISSNYVRLMVNVCFGLVLVRILLTALGNEAWGLIALLGSTIGLTAMFHEIVNLSMIRELAEAHHEDDPVRFRATYNSALLLTALVAVLSLGLMGILWLALPWFNIPEHLLDAGRWMVLCKAIETFVFIITAAPVNMFKVTERMVIFNFCLIVDRTSFLGAAIWVMLTKSEATPAQGLEAYATMTMLLLVGGKLIQAILSMSLDPRRYPAPRLATRTAFRRILHVGGWNTAAVTAMNLHIRLDSVLMNLFFGLFGNVIFGLTAQLGSYIRMITMGMTEGIDAVSARISATQAEQKLHLLLRHSTRLHGLVAMPAAVGLFVLAEPLLVTWVGDRLEDPQATLAPTVMLIRLLMVGMVCRAIGDGWIALLYGAGHIRKYAPTILIGGLINPALAIGLIIVLPDSQSFTGPVLSYSLIFLITHLIIIPRKVASILELPLHQVYAPLLRPLVATLICMPLLLLLPQWIPASTLIGLASNILVFGIIYSLLCLIVVFNQTERQRMMRALGSLINRSTNKNQSQTD